MWSEGKMAVCLRKVTQLLAPSWGHCMQRLPHLRALCSAAPQSSDPKLPEPGSAVEIPEGEGRPHLLNVVWRIRSLKRRPYWERDIMKQLLLDRMNFPVVHKNTESVNTLLRQVRHLVRIKPVILKQGLPNGDYDSTLLKWNGEFIVRRKLNNVGKEIAAGVETSHSKKDDRTGDLSSK